MSQSVCSRCLAPLSEPEKRRQTLLCHRCEPAWALQFENLVHDYQTSHPDLLATPAPQPTANH